MRELDLQEFVDEIYVDFKKNEDTEYIFFLGAGCSKSSGIPLASELAEQWYSELKIQKMKFDKFNEKHNISNKTKVDYGKYYFEIFEELFPTPLMQQKEIQRITNDEKVNPSLGYYVLASLMQYPPFNTIVTTNFDNLIQDALIYSGNKRALVITHQDLAQFIKRDNTPLITKIHGDAHMHPFNNKGDTKNIPDILKGAIQGLFINAKVICIGYGGNDESIADLLEGCNRIDQVYWLNNSEPKEVKLSKWWDNISTKTYINEYDFDKIMNLIKSKFNIEAPDFDKIAKKLQDSYNCALEEEIEEIEQIEDKDKTFLDYFLLGNTYLSKEKYDKAIESYEKAIAINPKKDETYYNMGNAYVEQGEYDKAIESYEKAIEINPKDDESYCNMGIAYVKQGEYDKAIESYEKAIEINPKRDETYYNMGIAYVEQGEYDKAIESYEKAIEINPKRDETYYNMGNAYGEQGEYDKAIESYEKAIEINPKDDETYYNMGIAYVKQGEYDKAIESYEKAIEINPKDDETYYNMGNAYGEQGEYDKAIESYEKAIEINPKKDEAYNNLFELQIIQNQLIDGALEQQFISSFKQDKNIYCQYELLKLFSNIAQGKKVNIDKWLKEYESQSLSDRSFDELEKWANTKENNTKEKLLEAIEVFKTKKITE